jgi:hypothetical protein
VQISGQEVMLKNRSYFKKSTGDEAGAAPKKGMISSKNMGKVFFTAWSMDVKVEGENVVRHLDLTTHNHGSNANEAGPWPYQDALAMNEPGHPCKEMAEAIGEKCSSEDDYSNACCAARKCFLMPKKPNKCCNSPGTKIQMTGHHLLPSKEFVLHEGRSSVDPVTNYKSDDAPTLCVKGRDHAKTQEHGQVGCNYTVEKKKWLADPKNKRKKYSLANGCRVAAKSAIGKVKVPKGAKGCDEACLERQLSDGHARMGLTVKRHDELPNPGGPKKPRIT